MDVPCGSPRATWLAQLDDELLETCFTVGADTWLDAELEERWARLSQADPEGARGRVLGSLAANLTGAFGAGGPHEGQDPHASTIAAALNACRPDGEGPRTGIARWVPERLLRVAHRAAGVATNEELAPLLEPYVEERIAFLKGAAPSWDPVALDNRLVEALNDALETGRSFTQLLGADYAPVLARCLERAAGDVYRAWRESPETLRDWHAALDGEVLAGLAHFEAERRARADHGTP